jgi:flagellum-specific peptidoglycan hydrolase FlgJ
MTIEDRLSAEVAPEVLEKAWLDRIAAIEDEAARVYIERFWRIAADEYRKSGYRPSMKLAQGGVETGWNSSTLAKKNAHFGIKAGWKSTLTKTVAIHEDDSPRDVFHTYNTAEDSWRDHTLFILMPRYKKTIDAPTLERACYELGVSGYATSQYKWPKKSGGYTGTPGCQILSIIKRYHLEELDRMVGIQD